MKLYIEISDYISIIVDLLRYSLYNENIKAYHVREDGEVRVNRPKTRVKYLNRLANVFVCV